MSQESVYKWLKEHPTWQTTTTINKGLPHISRSSITMNVFKLRKGGFIEFRKSRRKKNLGKGYLEIQYRYLPPKKV